MAARHRRWLLVLVLLVLATVIGWWLLHPRPGAVDLADVLPLNNEGVGLMERFEYERAVEVFEQVVARAPDWLPGRINLGIALLNAGGTSSPEMLARTRATFEEVLRRAPDNLHAHHCLGVLLMHQKDAAEAIRHFERVTALDPGDASAWFFLGLLLDDPERRSECFHAALRCDPYHTGALYQVGLEQSRRDPAKGKATLDVYEALKRSEWGNPTAVKYGEMGRYGEVIGWRQPRNGAAAPHPPVLRQTPLKVRLAPGARWATEADFGEDATGRLRRRFRARFGGVVVCLDCDGDGRMDLFLAGAVVEGGKVRDLLLRNTPEGFVDVTHERGLGAPFATLGVTVADLDNDGRPDLLLCGCDGVRFFRNTGSGKFVDLTAASGLDILRGVYFGVACADLDQDSDLDLVFAQYAPTAADALQALEGRPAAPGGAVVCLHVGEAPPAPPGGKEVVPLVCKYRRADLAGFDLRGHLAGVVLGDFDGDRDVDVVLLADGQAPQLVVNDRLLRFHRQELPAPAAGWSGGLTLDATHAGRSDLLLVPEGGAPQLLHNRGGNIDQGALLAPPLRQAAVADLDLDGWSDIIGLTADGQLEPLHNDGGRLRPQRLLIQDEQKLTNLLAVVPTVLDPDAANVQPDLVVWSAEGLSRLAPAEPRHHGLLLKLTGRMAVEPGGAPVRCNADAVGAFVVAQAGGLWAGAENATLSAGPGQSRQPLLLGLGPHEAADVVRLRWPDGTLQAELHLPAGRAAIAQANRKKTSCPVLFTWDGSRFVFVTDFLGEGSLGELGPDGRTRPPRNEESVKIEPGQLAPRDGRYEIEIAEPMDEVAYLDQLRLVAIDHPADVQVYPDERFAAGGSPPTQELVAFTKAIFPERATDHRGANVTKTLRQRDRDTVSGFAQRSWLGFAEEHHVTLDFGDQLAKFDKKDRLYLCLSGWTDYPYPESIWAAHQAGVAMLPPVLERLGDDGAWRKLLDAGFPAGLPKTMLLDVTGLLTGPRCQIRLRTNLHVHWDQAFIGVVSPAPITNGVLTVESAQLSPSGLHQEYSPDGRLPTVYAHDRFDNAPVVRLAGRLTRHGDVTELLRDADDRLVVFGPHDRLRVRFDGRSLPPLPAGWRRSFVLRTVGYCKDAGPFTATGTTVEPLPFRGMKRYPRGPDDRPLRAAEYRDYLRRYQTREVR